MGSIADRPRRSIYARYPASTLLVVNLLLCLLSLVLAEILLRASGARTLRQQILQTVAPYNKRLCAPGGAKPLPVALPFFTDAEGVFKANKDFDFATHPFWGRYGIHINRDGFRSREFLPPEDGSETILLLGDSFAWGASATPISKSFADRLDRAGYCVFNAGIPGVDPTQYARIAQKWVPKLRPKVTAAFVFLGNDIGTSPMLVKPNRNLWYVTLPQYRFLLGYDEYGHYFDSPDEVLPYYRRTYCGETRDTVDLFMYRTVLGKLLHDALVRARTAVVTDTTRAWVRRSLSEIQSVCARHDSKFLLFLIPVNPGLENTSNSLRDNLRLFEGFDPHYPRKVLERDFNKGDEHLNNHGHKRYSRFVLNVLARSSGSGPRLR